MSEELINIHCRFAPNGQTLEISERPAALDPHEWFNRLSAAYVTQYRAYAGGRGLFKLTRAQIEAAAETVGA